MNTLLSTTVTEEELRLRMDRRTVVQQEGEIRHLRRRLERLAERPRVTSEMSSVANEAESLAA